MRTLYIMLAVTFVLALLAGLFDSGVTDPLVAVQDLGFTGARSLGRFDAYRSSEPLVSSLELAGDLAERLFAMSGVDARVTLTEVHSGKYAYIHAADRSASFYYTPLTGDISFSRGTAEYAAQGDTPGLPDDEEVVKLARGYIEALGLLPEVPGEMVLSRTGGLNMAECRGDGTTVDYRKQVWVYFGRVIDGVEVTGPGSKIIVHLGRYGELTGLIRRWTEVRERLLPESAFIRDDEVVGKIAHSLAAEWGAAMEIEAETPRFVIFDDGHGILEPAYTTNAKVFHFLPGDFLAEDVSLSIVPALRRHRAWYEQQEKAPLLPETWEPDIAEID